MATHNRVSVAQRCAGLSALPTFLPPFLPPGTKRGQRPDGRSDLLCCRATPQCRPGFRRAVRLGLGRSPRRAHARCRVIAPRTTMARLEPSKNHSSTGNPGLRCRRHKVSSDGRENAAEESGESLNTIWAAKDCAVQYNSRSFLGSPARRTAVGQVPTGAVIRILGKARSRRGLE